METAWKRKDGKGCYSIGSLWYMVVNRDMRQPEYMKSAGHLSIPVVVSTDRQEVIEFFTGAKTIADAIDEKLRGDTMIRRAGLKQGKVIPVSAPASSQQDPLRKRDAKAEDKKREKKIHEVLLEQEKKIAGKTNCLQAQGRSFLSVLQVAY